MIRTDPDDFGYIYCYGLLSCANINNLYNSDGYIYCRGELSCHDSIIYVDSHLVCGADSACSQSNITNNYNVFAYDSFALYNSFI